jgi:hypothetical protein
MNILLQTTDKQTRILLGGEWVLTFDAEQIKANSEFICDTKEGYIKLNYSGEIPKVQLQYRHTKTDKWRAETREEWDGRVLRHRKRKVAVIL